MRKGERGLFMAMPRTHKRVEIDETTGEEREIVWNSYVYPSNWFVLSQTDGDELEAVELPTWDEAQALAALEVERVEFEMLDGNCMGYAMQRKVAVSPLNPMPAKTMFHEIAHVVLGHTSEGTMNDDERTPRSIREAEAEGVAMLCCYALGLDGAAESRGYIQSWLAGDEVDEKSAGRIFKAADEILDAGGALSR